MHTSGKVLVFLVLIAGAASTVLTSKLIQVRNSWTVKAQRFDEQYAQTASDLEKQTKDFLTLRNEIESALREWGATTAVNTQIADQTTGRMQIDAGTNFGLKDQALIHGFQLLPDGTSIYRGPFTVTSAQADQAVVVPAWRLRRGEVQGTAEAPGWQGGTWRWRSVVPSGYSTRVDDQRIAFLKSEQTLDDRNHSLAIQQRLVADAQRQLQLRVAELVGGPELPQDPALAPEDREGLLSPLKATEEERNKLLLEIAALREAVRAERNAVQRLQSENQVIAGQLPQPAAVISGRDSGVSQ